MTKILVERMKPLMSQIISEEQSAFMEGRKISDNILIMQEYGLLSLSMHLL
jgi:hypothetical protein